MYSVLILPKQGSNLREKETRKARKQGDAKGNPRVTLQGRFRATSPEGSRTEAPGESS